MTERFQILIADDDPDDHLFFEEALFQVNPVDPEVQKVFNGKEVADYLRNCKLPPDLIILDLNMPLVDGLSTLKEIKALEKFRNIPVFILTTSYRETDREKCMELGCVEYYAKPYGMEGYIRIVEDIFTKIPAR